MLPNLAKNILRSVKRNIFDALISKYTAWGAERSHVALVNKLKNKNKIRVLFLAYDRSVWKVESIFQRMLADDKFDPYILICPYTHFDKKKMLEDMEVAYQYFYSKGYSVKKAMSDSDEWVVVDDLNPDIVFFTNPHSLTKSDYYQKVFRKYLCCYVPYYFMPTNHVGENRFILNTPMLNSMWRIYWPHNYISAQYSEYSSRKGYNAIVTGYPAVEDLLKQPNNTKYRDKVWKKKELKKIIYAPHHSLGNNGLNSISTFLKFADKFLEISEKFKDTVQWAFKPHPMLKSKLYQHPNWGNLKTDKYYQYWAESDHTQLSEGEYNSLFLESDAIIHDCSSFIVEYVFTRKPALYLYGTESKEDAFLNPFGKGMINAYYKASYLSEIESFVFDVANNYNSLKGSDSLFFNKYYDSFYRGVLPSERIMSDIKSFLR